MPFRYLCTLSSIARSFVLISFSCSALFLSPRALADRDSGDQPGSCKSQLEELDPFFSTDLTTREQAERTLLRWVRITFNSLRLGPDHEREDLIAVTAHKLLTAIRNGQVKTNLKSYTIRACVLNSAEYMRGSANRRAREEYLDSAPEPAVPPTAETDLACNRARAALKAALDSIDPMYGEPVRLRHLDGLHPSDIAKKLRLTEQTAKTRIHRGLKFMKDALQAQGVWSTDTFF